jgi:hypothetical protein
MNKLFFVIYHFSLGKAAMNAPNLRKLRKDCLTVISQAMAYWC